MKVTTGTIYEAFDGAKFTTEYDCKKYETERKLIKKGLDLRETYDEVMEDIKHYCGQMVVEEYDEYEERTVCTSETCPFNDKRCICNCILEKLNYMRE